MARRRAAQTTQSHRRGGGAHFVLISRLTTERTPGYSSTVLRAQNANVMINVSADIAPEARELAATAREQLDDLVTYATHLVNPQADAVAFVAGGIHPASRYPPARLRVDGRAALYRAVRSEEHTSELQSPC